MKKTLLLVAALISWAVVHQSLATSITFEDLPLGNPGTDGSTQYGTTGNYYWNGSNGAGSFTSGGATFSNSFTDFGTFTAWDGFAYSNTKDTLTSGFGNQYSSITGGGVSGSDKYAVGYQPWSSSWTISFGSSQSFAGHGLYATNTTYAYFSMLNGDGFGGTPFSLGGLDYFDLTITGSLAGNSTGSVTFHLADFRSGPGYIVNSWTWVDLTALGTIDELQFSTSASQSSVPTYFALDNLGSVPEPSALVLVSLSFGLGLFLYARKRFHAR